MPGKAGTGATAQMASSGYFTGLQDISHTDILLFEEFQIFTILS
jgi:hypothetical protein